VFAQTAYIKKKRYSLERIGLIDLGSNTARLVIFDVHENEYFTIVDEMKESVRLGEMEKDSTLKTARVTQAVVTLKLFKKMCEANKADKIIAVATAAVRNAKNQKTFLNEVFSATGIKVRVLTEEEEENYVYQGVINSMEIAKGIIMEIGGGGTKLVYYNRRNILKQAMLPFGAVTLTEMFAGSGDKPEEIAAKIEDHVKEELQRHSWLKELDPDAQFIGVGGSFRNLSKISRRIRKYPIEMVHNYQMNKTDFTNIYDMIKVLDLDKKMKIKGLSAVRADVFPSALAIMKAFYDYMGFEMLTTSGCGLREGYMFNYTVPQTLEKPISDVLGYSLDLYMKNMRVNIPHAEQVYNLCIQLFRQLRVLHKFPRAYLRILRVCALMHETGKSFKEYNYQKHSAYMILNGSLYGISHKDVVLSAFVTDLIEKDEVKMQDWASFKDLLNEEEIEAGKKLAVMLRLAIGLDKSLNNAVKEINCDVLGDSVIMKTETEGADSALEIKAALTTSNEFKRVFKKNLEIL
jgi:exopolyphosphatase/guanosine-5'-triphosphate,3'-diphosphate pyrophosphatase